MSRTSFNSLAIITSQYKCVYVEHEKQLETNKTYDKMMPGQRS